MPCRGSWPPTLAREKSARMGHPALMRTRTTSNTLDGQAHSIASAQAKGGDSFVLAAVLKSVKQRGQDARAAGADGVANGHCSAVHVDLGGVELQFAIYRQGLYAECLVQFEEVHIGERPSGLGRHCPDSLDGSQANPLRLPAAGGLGANDGQRLEAQPGGPLAAHDDKGGRAVVRSEEHTSELQSLRHLVCRLLL